MGTVRSRSSFAGVSLSLFLRRREMVISPGSCPGGCRFEPCLRNASEVVRVRPTRKNYVGLYTYRKAAGQAALGASLRE